MVKGGPKGGVSARVLLDLQQVGERRFRSVENQDNGLQSIFGGQALCQALAAATRTAPAWPAHTCTGYFLRGGAVAAPVDYEVEIVRNGRRYAARRVVAWQNEKPIFDLLCSFHDLEEGGSHQAGDADFATAGDPELLPALSDIVKANPDQISPNMAAVHESFPIDLRMADTEGLRLGTVGTPRRAYWLRMPSAAEVSDAQQQQCLLAFLSDYWFPSASAAPHQGTGRRFNAASLNHSLWFHAPARADEWLLWRTDSPWTGDGRGQVRGLIYNRAGILVASAVQEISMREPQG